MVLSLANPNPDGKIRLLILTDELEVGGTQRQIVHLARSLDPTLYVVKVAYFCHRSFLADQLESAGIQVIEIAKSRGIDIGFIINLVKFLRRENFDIVHCFALSAEFWGTFARRFLPAKLRPALFTSVRNKYDWYSHLQWQLKRWTALESSRVIANSRAGADYACEKMHLASDAIDVVYNGVEETLLPSNSGATAQSPGINILFVGRLVKQKNVPLLLRALKKLQSGAVPIRLRIVGDGPLRENLIAQITELQITGSIELLGERNDIAALMATADFIVSPSSWEGLSNVILEAMMAGIPVIASAVGGSVELVDDMKTGILFPSENDDALTKAINTLAADAALRERMGAAGRQRVIDQFSIAAMVRAMQGFYSQAAAERLSLNMTQSTPTQKARQT